MSSWSDLVPAIHFGSQGHSLGYYYTIANYLFILPLSLLLLVAIGYNVLVGLATKWMYTNAWNKKEDEDADSAKPLLPKTNFWEEVYVVNMKIARYLLGNTINLKESNGYLVLTIHDYHVYMPLAMILIQVSQVAVAMILIVLFVDYSVLEVYIYFMLYHTPH